MFYQEVFKNFWSSLYQNFLNVDYEANASDNADSEMQMPRFPNG